MQNTFMNVTTISFLPTGVHFFVHVCSIFVFFAELCQQKLHA